MNTLVLVHRQQLLDQWCARLAMFLKLPADSIGQVGGGKTKPSGLVDIAIIQSTHDKAGVKDFVAEYGQVIIDECHHLSAFTFEQVMKQVKAKCVLGLTAIPERKDEDTALQDVAPERVSTFLNGIGPLTASWHVKHNALLGFYRYAISRGCVVHSPLPMVIPKRPPAFQSYFYS